MPDIEPMLNRVSFFSTVLKKKNHSSRLCRFKKNLSLTQRPAGNTSVLVSQDWLGEPDIFLNTLFSCLHIINNISRLTLEAVLQQSYLTCFLELQDFQQHLGPGGPWKFWPQPPLVSYHLLQAEILCHSQPQPALA